MNETWIVDAVRTPFGKFGKVFQNVSGVELGRIVVDYMLRNHEIDKEEVNEVIMGNVIGAGLGQNPARQIALKSGLPSKVGAFTVNKVCGSGLKSIILGTQAIKTGDVDVVIAGGIENMSQAPHLINGYRWDNRYGDEKLVDSLIHDGLWDAFDDIHMMTTGEIVAEKYKITRERADEFAYLSHQKAIEATDKGELDNEIVEVEIKTDGKKKIIKHDQGMRRDTTLEKLSYLKPLLGKGIITAGNSSQMSDGAAGVILMNKDKAKELGLRPLAKIISYSTSGVPPSQVMESPIIAVKKLLKSVNLDINQIDLFEHNEAFATASLAISDQLKIKIDRLNVRGGAISIGHPLGASGARLVISLLNSLRDRGLRRGIATLCMGGGNGLAILITR